MAQDEQQARLLVCDCKGTMDIDGRKLGGATVTALRDGTHFRAALDAHSSGHAGSDSGRVAKERMEPGDLP